MYTVLLVIHVIITLSLIAIILLQRSSTDGLGGMGGGAGGGFMTSRGQANLLTRTTAILAALFIINSLALSWLTQQDAPSRSIADEIIEREVELQVPTPEDVKLNVIAPEKAVNAVAMKKSLDTNTTSPSLAVPQPE